MSGPKILRKISRAPVRARLGTLLACFFLVAGFLSGCATTTSSVRNPEISAQVRGARHASADDALSRDARAQQLFLRGMTEARLGDHDAALTLYAQALELAPRTAAILAATAESHEALGDDDAAIHSMRRAHEYEPDNPHYGLQLAELYLSTGDADRAAAAYGQVLDAFPHNLDALYELARVYTMSGELTRAVETYRQLLGEIGSDPDVLGQILQLYARLGDTEGMERTLGDMLQDAPHDVQLFRMLAEVYVKQDRDEDAASALRNALEVDPGDVPTMLSLAELYREMGLPGRADSLMRQASSTDSNDPARLLAQATSLYQRADDDAGARQSATELLERVLEIDSNKYEALLMLGNLRLDAEHYDDAASLFYRALDVNPRDLQLWMHASSAFLQAGRLERAVEVADEGLMLFPGSVPLMRISGYALMDAYQNRAAIDRFEEAVAIIQEDESEDATDLSDLYSALGLLYTRTRDIEQADRSYEKAIESNPNNATALNNYAFSLADREDRLEEAKVLAERAVEIDPDVPSYLDTLGWVLFKLDRAQDALTYLRQAVEKQGASAAVYEHLGDVLDAVGQPEAARDAWTRALEMNPQRSGLQEKINRD